MRLTLLALFVALGASSGARAADWVEVVAGKDRRVEIDKASILQSDPGTKVAWGRIVMRDEDVASAGYKSVKALNRYDCRSGTFSTIKRVYLDADQQLMREERVVEPKVIQVAPGSVDERLFREVCQPPSANQLAQIAEQAAEAARESAPAEKPPAEVPAPATPAAASPAAKEVVQAPETPEEQKSIVPHFVRPLTLAEKQAAVQARLAALEHADAKSAASAHGSEPAHGSAEAPSHSAPPARPAPTPRPQTIREHQAPATQAEHAPQPALNPKIVLARATPAESHVRSSSKAASRAAEKPAQPDYSHVHWSYEGAGGPDNWGKLKPEFAACDNGQRQSPINIDDGIKVELAPIEFEYRPSYFRIVDNGHTVQVNVGVGSSIRVMGRIYDLVQFHFHRPSEFRIDGRGYDMEAHLVHKDLDGRLAVVSVMLERGTAHPIIQTLWNNLPLERNSSYTPDVAIDPNELLPVDRRYATFMGSLTTPPCTEGVMWMVMRQPVPISVEQISIFSRLHPMNARPLQAAGDRLVKISQ